MHVAFEGGDDIAIDKCGFEGRFDDRNSDQYLVDVCSDELLLSLAQVFFSGEDGVSLFDMGNGIFVGLEEDDISDGDEVFDVGDLFFEDAAQSAEYLLAI